MTNCVLSKVVRLQAQLFLHFKIMLKNEDARFLKQLQLTTINIKHFTNFCKVV